MAISTLIPDVPDPADHERVVKFVQRVRLVLNPLLRAGIIAPGPTLGSTTITLGDGDIPDEITRDTELAAAIAALADVYQPLDDELTVLTQVQMTEVVTDMLAYMIEQLGYAPASEAAIRLYERR